MAPITLLDDARKSTLQKLVAIRLERLGEDSRRVLQNASAIGIRFEYRILKALLGPVNEYLLNDALRELEKFDLIFEVSKFPQRILEFKNSEICNILYEFIPAHQKLKLHTRIGLYLEKTHFDDEDIHLLKIARHFLNSDDDIRAVKYSVKAGSMLLKQYYLKDALNLFNKAYDICSNLDCPDYKNIKREIFSRKFEIYLLLGNYDLALNSLDLLKKQTHPQNVKENLIIQIMFCEVLIEKGDFSKALSILLNIYKTVKKDAMKDLLPKTLQLLSYIYTFRENIDKARKKCKEGLSSCSEDICMERGCFYSYLGFVEYCGNNYGRAHAYFKKAMNIFEALDDKAFIGKTFCNIGMIYFKQGLYNKALENYLQSREILENIEYLRAFAITRMNLAVLYDHLGNYKKAIKEYNAVLRISEITGNSRVLMMVFCNLGEVFTRLGKFKTSVRYLSDSITLSKEIGSLFWQLSGKLYLGTCYNHLNNRKEAVKLLNESIQIAQILKEKNKIIETKIELLRLDIKSEKSFNKLKQLYEDLKENKSTGISENLEIKILELLSLNRIWFKDICSAKQYIEDGLRKSHNLNNNSEFNLIFSILRVQCFDISGNKKDAVENLKKSRVFLIDNLRTIPQAVQKYYLRLPLISELIELLSKYGLKSNFKALKGGF